MIHITSEIQIPDGGSHSIKPRREAEGGSDRHSRAPATVCAERAEGSLLVRESALSKFNVKGKGSGGGAKRASIINTLCDDASVVVTAATTGKTKDWVSVCLCGGWEWRRRMEEEERVGGGGGGPA